VRDRSGTSSTYPATSWPKVIGVRMRPSDHSFQSKMCRSVPQIDAAWTRSRTSPSPGSGIGTSTSWAPRARAVFRNARIVPVICPGSVPHATCAQAAERPGTRRPHDTSKGQLRPFPVP